jgi:hypothetical protein
MPGRQASTVEVQLHTFNPCTCWWMNLMPQLLYPQETNLVPTDYKSGWAPQWFWMVIVVNVILIITINLHIYIYIFFIYIYLYI